MGTRDDASLTARERAALANLEARAAADDPQFAHRLRGRHRPKISLQLPAVPSWTGPGWCSIPVVVIGLVLVVLGLADFLAVSIIGVVVTGVGLWMVAGFVDRRIRSQPTRG